jgi:3'-phosphoadenosine 5'-phosphosulfate sulfotransferase (PAPS reductase)/FAD synthetase
MRHNIVSLSGGKDSTALLLLALERNTENLQAVFADTGHEHPQTYEYVQYLNKEVFPIRTVKADFTEAINRKRARLQTIADGGIDARNESSKHKWTQQRAKEALEFLQPTSIPFLDMVLARGFFPSTRRRFCSEELKRNPMIEQVQLPLLENGDEVYSWQGVRSDESIARANLDELEAVGGGLFNYRPILKWTVEDVFAMHDKHGIKPNPLYKQGMGRVGCMPCIHAKKDELLEISKRFPEEIKRVAEWERLTTLVNVLGAGATFFSVDKMGIHLDTADIDSKEYGIWKAVEWSKTSRGGKQSDMFREQEGPLCSSMYGLCE